jgi:hypothetical protein
VHDDDGAGARSDGGFDAGRIEVEGDGIDVDEDRVLRVRRRTALATAMKVNEGTMTSSPGPMLSARIARCSAAVPELTAMAWGTP